MQQWRPPVKLTVEDGDRTEVGLLLTGGEEDDGHEKQVLACSHGVLLT
jgi:hypothetical protein